MERDAFGRWLALAGNLGVIAGLVLVAVQINQNTQITRAQIANDYFMADMALELAMMGENPAQSWSKAVYAPGSLTTEDAVVLDRYFNYGLVQLHRFREMEEMGLAPEGWEERVGYLRWHLGNEVGRRWWRAVAADYPDEFREQVENVMAGYDYSYNREMLDALTPGGATPGESPAEEKPARDD